MHTYPDALKVAEQAIHEACRSPEEGAEIVNFIRTQVNYRVVRGYYDRGIDLELLFGKPSSNDPCRGALFATTAARELGIADQAAIAMIREFGREQAAFMLSYLEKDESKFYES